METDSRKNETILAIILIAVCLFQVVHYSMYLIKYEWGVVFWYCSWEIKGGEIMDDLRAKYPFYWLTYLFNLSLVVFVGYGIFKSR